MMEANTGLAVDCAPRSISIEERLTQRKIGLERDLKSVNYALEALRKNPEVMNVINLTFAKLHRRYLVLRSSIHQAKCPDRAYHRAYGHLAFQSEKLNTL